jgi:hypothetical protein
MLVGIHGEDDCVTASATPHVEVPMDAIRAFCARHDIVRISLFGSVLRDDFRADSDIDILVEFAPGVRYGVSGLVAMAEELEALFGRAVDLIDRKAIEQSANYIRRKVIMDSEQVIYEKR